MKFAIYMFLKKLRETEVFFRRFFFGCTQYFVEIDSYIVLLSLFSIDLFLGFNLRVGSIVLHTTIN